jgi:hypothetical protein
MKHVIAPLTADQRTHVLDFLASGADLESVCRYACVTIVQLRLEMKRDPDFAQAAARAEAKVELLQMGNVMKAARDEKNWRTSVWWIERRSRLRKAAEDRALSESDLLELMDALSQVIVQEIADPLSQQRVIERLLDIVAQGPRDALITECPPLLPFTPLDAPPADARSLPPDVE